MAKNLKLKIKNTQLAKAAGLDKLKAKLAGEKPESDKEKQKKTLGKTKAAVPTPEEEKPRRIRAKTKSDFAPADENAREEEIEEEEALSPSVDYEEVEEEEEKEVVYEEEEIPAPQLIEAAPVEEVPLVSEPIAEPSAKEEIKEEAPISSPPAPVAKEPVKEKLPETPPPPPRERLGPTGRHIKDLLPPKREKKEVPSAQQVAPVSKEDKAKPTKKEDAVVEMTEEERDIQKNKKIRELREFKDLKPLRKQMRSFDARDRQGLGETEEERWRKRRPKQPKQVQEEQIIRPTSLKIRLPITIKNLAAEMKLKSSELIQKLFLQGIILTLNDFLDDETTVQFLGSEFGCEITIDTSEEERIQISSKSIQEEIEASDPDQLVMRPPVVAFMGHVDHGKTSLIDAIRKSNIAAAEAGAITQHMGAFRCHTAVGDITILDTPGHEAFSAMRARGAEVTDIVVLVVAGDEGIREQTLEAVQHAKSAGVTIVVALNKCDKPNFNAENVYRQLAEIELLPEAWGGNTITVNTSATTGEGMQQLLEMLALQAEVLELRADPTSRARGTVLESEMHKGMGSVATILVQNGTLRQGDAIVFERLWGRVKTMRDEHGKNLTEAGPSAPVEITGLSGLPAAGDPFIVVKNEKEAREIAEARTTGMQQRALLQKKVTSLEGLMQGDKKAAKKVLKLILRADVQGSVEALKTSLYKIHSDKAEIDVIFTGVGEISESDVQLAAASNAVIIGFHTQVESHAESLIKEMNVTIRLHDIIYHAIEDTKKIMQGLLDKIEEEKETGVAEVKATFKASQLGVIAGCQVIEGTISRNNRIRVVRQGEVVWKGAIGSLKRIKEDVKEVKKGFECGILLAGYNDVQSGDLLQAYEIIYRTQEL